MTKTLMPDLAPRWSEILNYANSHRGFSFDQVLLGKGNIPSDLRSDVALQIRAYRQFERKFGLWIDPSKTYFPSMLSGEQASSVSTALFKQKFVQPSDVVVDLTGGFGVDFSSMMQVAAQGWYNDINPNYAQVAQFNFSHWINPAKKISFSSEDSLFVLTKCLTQVSPTLIYLDPDRRQRGKRVFAIEDCQPDLSEVLIRLTSSEYKGRLLVKLSPMLDVTQVLRQVEGVSAIYLVESARELKEILLYFDFSSEGNARKSTPIVAVNAEVDSSSELLSAFVQDHTIHPPIAHNFPYCYIYEPSPAVMKQSHWHSLCEKYEVEKLGHDSHLFLSNQFVENFPGRRFLIDEMLDASSSNLKRLAKELKYARILVRGSRFKAEELAQRLRVKEKSDCPTLILGKREEELLFVAREIK